MAPNTPKEQSMALHQSGIPLKWPAIKANGMTARQAIKPKSITQTLRTGSRQGPMNATAMTRCAKASQSVP